MNPEVLDVGLVGGAAIGAPVVRIAPRRISARRRVSEHAVVPSATSAILLGANPHAENCGETAHLAALFCSNVPATAPATDLDIAMDHESPLVCPRCGAQFGPRKFKQYTRHIRDGLCVKDGSKRKRMKQGLKQIHVNNATADAVTQAKGNTLLHLHLPHTCNNGAQVSDVTNSDNDGEADDDDNSSSSTTAAARWHRKVRSARSILVHATGPNLAHVTATETSASDLSRNSVPHDHASGTDEGIGTGSDGEERSNTKLGTKHAWSWPGNPAARCAPSSFAPVSGGGGCIMQIAAFGPTFHGLDDTKSTTAGSAFGQAGGSTYSTAKEPQSEWAAAEALAWGSCYANPNPEALVRSPPLLAVRTAEAVEVVRLWDQGQSQSWPEARAGSRIRGLSGSASSTGGWWCANLPRQPLKHRHKRRRTFSDGDVTDDVENSTDDDEEADEDDESDHSFRGTNRASSKRTKLRFVPVDTLRFRHRLQHLATSPYAEAEAAVMGCGGELYLWNAADHSRAHNPLLRSTRALSSTDTSSLGKAQARGKFAKHTSAWDVRSAPKVVCNVRTDRTSLHGDEFNHMDVPWMWARVEWAAHPRQLWLASRQHVSLLDIRCRASAVACIRGLSAGDNIVASWARASDGAGEVVTALTRHPGNPAQALIATSRSLQLIDCRAPRAPLLCWPHHLGKSDATTLQLERNLDPGSRSAVTGKYPETNDQANSKADKSSVYNEALRNKEVALCRIKAAQAAQALGASAPTLLHVSLCPCSSSAGSRATKRFTFFGVCTARMPLPETVTRNHQPQPNMPSVVSVAWREPTSAAACSSNACRAMYSLASKVHESALSDQVAQWADRRIDALDSTVSPSILPLFVQLRAHERVQTLSDCTWCACPRNAVSSPATVVASGPMARCVMDHEIVGFETHRMCDGSWFTAVLGSDGHLWAYPLNDASKHRLHSACASRAGVSIANNSKVIALPRPNSYAFSDSSAPDPRVDFRMAHTALNKRTPPEHLVASSKFCLPTCDVAESSASERQCGTPVTVTSTKAGIHPTSTGTTLASQRAAQLLLQWALLHDDDSDKFRHMDRKTCLLAHVLPALLSGARKMLALSSATERNPQFDNDMQTDSSTKNERVFDRNVAQDVAGAFAAAGDAGIAQYARMILEPMLKPEIFTDKQHRNVNGLDADNYNDESDDYDSHHDSDSLDESDNATSQHNSSMVCDVALTLDLSARVELLVSTRERYWRPGDVLYKEAARDITPVSATASNTGTVSSASLYWSLEEIRIAPTTAPALPLGQIESAPHVRVWYANQDVAQHSLSSQPQALSEAQQQQQQQQQQQRAYVPILGIELVGRTVSCPSTDTRADNVTEVVIASIDPRIGDAGLGRNWLAAGDVLVAINHVPIVGAPAQVAKLAGASVPLDIRNQLDSQDTDAATIHDSNDSDDDNNISQLPGPGEGGFTSEYLRAAIRMPARASLTIEDTAHLLLDAVHQPRKEVLGSAAKSSATALLTAAQQLELTTLHVLRPVSATVSDALRSGFSTDSCTSFRNDASTNTGVDIAHQSLCWAHCVLIEAQNATSTSGNTHSTQSSDHVEVAEAQMSVSKFCDLLSDSRL